MSTAEVVLLAAMGVFLVVGYLGAGWLLLRRVREHSVVDGRSLTVVVIVLWPVVATGIEILWLFGVNDWHLR